MKHGEIIASAVLGIAMIISALVIGIALIKLGHSLETAGKFASKAFPPVVSVRTFETADDPMQPNFEVED